MRSPQDVPAPERRKDVRRRLLDLVPGDQLAGDYDALQLVGALADDEERRIAVEALDGELLGIAVAAMDAHRFEADIHRRLGGEQLGHAGFHIAALAFVVGPRRLVDQETRGLDLGRHVGELQLYGLVFADWLTERLPELAVAH